ncbi:unnamed protein product [Sphenostylis stenocarpa]|uniref:MCM9 N-terminal domain-containing protein n=1 Tax=Sphenostylis stenocarpa TaxID=92480 RepID=A0AA86VPF0_9FABA|nr:unnamed protein product [Sphenostylis stenocarpa]
MENSIPDPVEFMKPMASFLIRHYSDQLHSIVSSPDSNLHFPLFVDFAELMEKEPRVAGLLFAQPNTYLPVFDAAAIWAHQAVLVDDMEEGKKGFEKKFIHVRINTIGSALEFPGLILLSTCLFQYPLRIFSSNDDSFHHGILLTLKGIVIRSGAIKMHEGERKYIVLVETLASHFGCATLQPFLLLAGSFSVEFSKSIIRKHRNQWFPVLPLSHKSL